jgi:putative transposase
MLNPTAFIEYCQALNLSPAALEQIRAIRSSEPVRRVQGRASNVCARYPSNKMGRIIQAESRTVELVAIRCAYEFEPQVLEYWDQPCRIPLQYRARNGRVVRVQHTPDFFVLRPDRAGWEEWKPLPQLDKLAAKMPQRYQSLPDGRWHCPPGEAYAAPLGLYYQVRTSSEFSPTYQRNVAILEDYLLDDALSLDPLTEQRLIAAVREQPGITLATLQAHFSSDELLRAIARDIIYADLESAPLVNLDQVRLFSSAELARAVTELSPRHPGGVMTRVDQWQVGTVIWWDERTWHIVNLGLERIALLPDEINGHIVELSRTDVEQLIALERILLPSTPPPPFQETALESIRQASPEALERANARGRAVEALLTGQKPQTSYAERTLRDYKHRYQEAQARFGSGWVGLLDDNARKGNRRSRLTPESQALLDRMITESYETLKQKSVLAVYGEYVLTCEKQNLKPASYTTFSKQVKRRPRAEQVSKRQGERAAYQTGPQFWWLAYDTPRHGDFPWQYGHIDHTQLDLEMVCAETGRRLGRPWLSLLLDAFSRRILAVYLTFDPPSYRSCMAVLVECVRRHQRLPDHILVDNGTEFRSTYFETLLAFYHVIKLARPTAQPRAGSLIERLFRTSETEFVHNLQGNTQIMKLARQVTRAVDPQNQAVWTLEHFYDSFCIWSYEVYDQMPHSTLGQSPRAAYLAGLAATGVRPHRRVVYDETFRILTLPTTRQGHAQVMAGRGIKVHYLYYWCDAFREPKVEGTRVPVRYDPFNAGLAYAYVHGLWERCISECYVTFQGHTQREMALATAALRQRQQLDRQQINIHAKTLAAFLASVEGQEQLLEQQLKDHAAHHIRQSIFGESPADNMIAVTASPVNSAPTKSTIDPKTLETYGAFQL